MASSQNLPSFEPFLFRPSFPDSWISEACARDSETLTRALQSTLSNFNSFSSSPSDHSVSLFNPPTPSASNASAASDPDSAPATAPSAPVKRRGAAPASTGRVTKRKSRASKRSQTTFINADPANFRQMVQQVTGARYCDGQLPVLKPEPMRIGGRLLGGGGCLPTLDTSSFLLDQQMVLGSGGSVGFAEPVLAEGVTEARVDLDCVSSFPTLESWS